MKNTILERIKQGQFVLIAEVGVNYYDIATEKGISPMEAAKLMIYEAKEAGIHAVKFQTYKAGTLAAKRFPLLLGYYRRADYLSVSAFQKFDSLWRGRVSGIGRLL